MSGAEVIALVEESCRELPRPVGGAERTATVVMILNWLLHGHRPDGAQCELTSARDHLARWSECLSSMLNWGDLPSRGKAEAVLAAIRNALATPFNPVTPFDSADDLAMAVLAAGQAMGRWFEVIPPDHQIGADMLDRVRAGRPGAVRDHWTESERIWRDRKAKGLPKMPMDVWDQLPADLKTSVSKRSYSSQFAAKVRIWEKRQG